MLIIGISVLSQEKRLLDKDIVSSCLSLGGMFDEKNMAGAGAHHRNFGRLVD